MVQRYNRRMTSPDLPETARERAILDAIARALSSTPGSDADTLMPVFHMRIGDVARRADPIEERPRVLVLESLDPPVAASPWALSLLSLAGGQSGTAGDEDGNTLAWSAINRADPDLLILAPRHHSLDQARAAAASILPLPEVRVLRAVRESRVFFLDGDLLAREPGLPSVDLLETFAEIVHPDLFHYGHPGWAKL